MEELASLLGGGGGGFEEFSTLDKVKRTGFSTEQKLNLNSTS